MKLPVLRLPNYLNIPILVISLIISGLSLLFGIAHIVESLVGEGNPDIPESEQIKGAIIVACLCLIGILFLLIGIAAGIGINEKINKKQSD